ncbi:unnamed protein product [Symbiodinium sp. CCMP2592]|nr:unnamed protein product [Symbiodinium sp. CCMP2592]
MVRSAGQLCCLCHSCTAQGWKLAVPAMEQQFFQGMLDLVEKLRAYAVALQHVEQRVEQLRQESEARAAAADPETTTIKESQTMKRLREQLKGEVKACWKFRAELHREVPRLEVFKCSKHKLRHSEKAAATRAPNLLLLAHPGRGHWWHLIKEPGEQMEQKLRWWPPKWNGISPNPREQMLLEATLLVSDAVCIHDETIVNTADDFVPPTGFKKTHRYESSGWLIEDSPTGAQQDGAQPKAEPTSRGCQETAQPKAAQTGRRCQETAQPKAAQTGRRCQETAQPKAAQTGRRRQAGEPWLACRRSMATCETWDGAQLKPAQDGAQPTAAQTSGNHQEEATGALPHATSSEVPQNTFSQVYPVCVVVVDPAMHTKKLQTFSWTEWSALTADLERWKSKSSVHKQHVLYWRDSQGCLCPLDEQPRDFKFVADDDYGWMGLQVDLILQTLAVVKNGIDENLILVPGVTVTVEDLISYFDRVVRPQLQGLTACYQSASGRLRKLDGTRESLQAFSRDALQRTSDSSSLDLRFELRQDRTRLTLHDVPGEQGPRSVYVSRLPREELTMNSILQKLPENCNATFSLNNERHVELCEGSLAMFKLVSLENSRSDLDIEFNLYVHEATGGSSQELSEALLADERPASQTQAGSAPTAPVTEPSAFPGPGESQSAEAEAPADQTQDQAAGVASIERPADQAPSSSPPGLSPQLEEASEADDIPVPVSTLDENARSPEPALAAQGARGRTPASRTPVRYIGWQVFFSDGTERRNPPNWTEFKPGQWYYSDIGSDDKWYWYKALDNLTLVCEYPPNVPWRWTPDESVTYLHGDSETLTERWCWDGYYNSYYYRSSLDELWYRAQPKLLLGGEGAGYFEYPPSEIAPQGPLWLRRTG